MSIPTGLVRHGRTIGWTVFALLALPLVFFAAGVILSGGFTPAKLGVAFVELALVFLVSWLLGRGLSKGSIALLALALTGLMLVLAAYAAAILLIAGLLKLRIF